MSINSELFTFFYKNISFEEKMKSFFLLALIACLVLGTLSHNPKNCKVCNADPKLCDEC